MSTASNQQLVTAEKLLRMPDVGRCELIAGELKTMTPAGHEHAWVVGQIAGIIHNHLRQRKLGRMYVGEGGFIVTRDPDTVRAPDVAFVRRGRLPAEPGGYFPGPPDLAVEVVCGDDRVREAEQKAQAWLEAGAQMVWVVWPGTRTVNVYRPNSKTVTLREDDTLAGGDVLAGFECPVSDIFAEE